MHPELRGQGELYAAVDYPTCALAVPRIQAQWPPAPQRRPASKLPTICGIWRTLLIYLSIAVGCLAAAAPQSPSLGGSQSRRAGVRAVEESEEQQVATRGWV